MNIAKKMSTFLYVYLLVLAIYTLFSSTIYKSASLNLMRPLGTTFGIVLHIIIILLTARMLYREVKDKAIRHLLVLSSFAFYTFFLIKTISNKVYFIN